MDDTDTKNTGRRQRILYFVGGGIAGLIVGLILGRLLLMMAIGLAAGVIASELGPKDTRAQ